VRGERDCGYPVARASSARGRAAAGASNQNMLGEGSGPSIPTAANRPFLTANASACGTAIIDCVDFGVEHDEIGLLHLCSGRAFPWAPDQPGYDGCGEKPSFVTIGVRNRASSVELSPEA
jgi:hypothetical protein